MKYRILEVKYTDSMHSYFYPQYRLWFLLFPYWNNCKKINGNYEIFFTAHEALKFVKERQAAYIRNNRRKRYQKVIEVPI